MNTDFAEKNILHIKLHKINNCILGFLKKCFFEKIFTKNWLYLIRYTEHSLEFMLYIQFLFAKKSVFIKRIINVLNFECLSLFFLTKLSETIQFKIFII